MLYQCISGISKVLHFPNVCSIKGMSCAIEMYKLNLVICILWQFLGLVYL